MLTENHFHHIQLIGLRFPLNPFDGVNQCAGKEVQWPRFGVVRSITGPGAVVESEALL
jgi:hypothetical protein